MSISFKKAMAVPYSDKNWIFKTGMIVILLLPYLFALLASKGEEPSLLASFLSFLASLLASGYILETAHNEIKGYEPILPEWDFIKSLLNALKAWVISVAYFLMTVPLLIIIFSLSMVDKSFIVISILLAIPVAVIYGYADVIAKTMFYEDLKIGDAFNFPRLFSLFKAGFGDYTKAFLWAIPIALIYVIPAGIIGALLAVSLGNKSYVEFFIAATQLIALFSVTNVLAQAYKNAKAKLQ